MAIRLTDKPYTDGVTVTNPFGKIRDESPQGANNGTPINTQVYGDMHQFFAKLMDVSGTPYSDELDNGSTVNDLFEALSKYVIDRTKPTLLKVTPANIPSFPTNANAVTDITGASITLPTDGKQYMVQIVGSCNMATGSDNATVKRLFLDVDGVNEDISWGEIDVANENENVFGLKYITHDTTVRICNGETVKLKAQDDGASNYGIYDIRLHVILTPVA